MSSSTPSLCFSASHHSNVSENIKIIVHISLNSHTLICLPFMFISHTNQTFIATIPLFMVINNVHLPKPNNQFLYFLFLFPVGFYTHYYLCFLIYLLICFQGTTYWTSFYSTAFSFSLFLFLIPRTSNARMFCFSHIIVHHVTAILCFFSTSVKDFCLPY